MILWRLKRTLLKIQSSLCQMGVWMGEGLGDWLNKRGDGNQAFHALNFSIFNSNFEN